MNDINVKTVPDELAAYFAEIGKVALAFSGGVDSSYLLYAALQCGADVAAYCVASQFQPGFELDDVKRLGRELNVDVHIIEVNVLDNEKVVENPANRCYYCKQSVFNAITEAAAADGYTLLMDGSNASDDAGDRPGMKALAELNVISPLREVGLTKQRIRDLSKEAGLFTWDKPAYACLATRIPTGVPIEAGMLKRVEHTEAVLHQMGFSDLRARVMGEAVKLQFPAEQIPAAAQAGAKIRERIAPWFDDVLLDLKPR